MATKQTRRSVSISGTTYKRLREYVNVNNKSMSGIVERQTLAFLDKEDRKAKKKEADKAMHSHQLDQQHRLPHPNP